MSGSPRVIILGAGGQLGRALQQSFSNTPGLIVADRTVVDLASPEQTRSAIRDLAPDVILNAAAYTAVDKAESEPELARAVNAVSPGILAREAARIGAFLVHYSTDYVFDGAQQTPWTESDTPHPLNVYGATKLAGEQAIRQAGGRFLIFRTSWVYGPEGNNFLKTMLRLGRERDHLSVVNDQIGAPTTTIELARATHTIVHGVLTGDFGLAEDWTGLYHMTCSGFTSWFGFAQQIFHRAGTLLGAKVPTLTPVSTSNFPTPARRPLNSVLSNQKLADRFGVRLAPWEQALDEVLGRLAESQPAQ
ncbi:MAG TPA: dTDP-4-dehydrorhamnose reductase [Terracidiphilus sp.]|nr:dTDP-4-dehydrorhamnose reductase [Terracidiphilus sp.]